MFLYMWLEMVLSVLNMKCGLICVVRCVSFVLFRVWCSLSVFSWWWWCLWMVWINV